MQPSMKTVRRPGDAARRCGALAAPLGTEPGHRGRGPGRRWARPAERRSTTGSSHPANSGGPEQLASRPSSGQGRPFGPTPRGSTALRLRRPQRRRPRARRPRRENPERVAARRGRQTRPPPHYRLEHGQNDPPRQRPPVEPVPAGSTLWNGLRKFGRLPRHYLLPPPSGGTPRRGRRASPERLRVLFEPGGGGLTGCPRTVGEPRGRACAAAGGHPARLAGAPRRRPNRRHGANPSSTAVASEASA